MGHKGERYTMFALMELLDEGRNRYLVRWSPCNRAESDSQRTGNRGIQPGTGELKKALDS